MKSIELLNALAGVLRHVDEPEATILDKILQDLASKNFSQLVRFSRLLDASYPHLIAVMRAMDAKETVEFPNHQIKDSSSENQ